jgi:hypothetical protein
MFPLRRRVAWAMGAGLVALGLVLEGYLTTVDTVAGGASVFAGVWRYLAFFTVLTNALVVAVLTHAVVRPAVRSGLGSPGIELMAATSIVLVGAIYNALLASQWHLVGWRRFDELVLHGVSPVLFVTYWLLRARGGLGWRAVLATLLWPMGYVGYVFARGAADGFHPYFFLDSTRVSWPRLAVHLAALLAAFVLVAWLLAKVDQALANRRASRRGHDGG